MNVFLHVTPDFWNGNVVRREGRKLSEDFIQMMSASTTSVPACASQCAVTTPMPLALP